MFTITTSKGENIMKEIDPKYFAKAWSFESEFKKPGSVIFLGTVAGGFVVYGISVACLIVYDIFLKLFS